MHFSSFRSCHLSAALRHHQCVSVDPAEGTADDDRNPAHIAPRNIFDLGIGTDDLLNRQEPSHIKLRFTISNLTNKVALYNFHSTFSGTHFVAPRTYSGAIGFVF